MSQAGTVTITRRLEWDALHRIPHHEGDCKAFHGHRYAANITCHAPELDALGRVIDFAVIKQEIGDWIDLHFDHTAILQRGDNDPATAAIIDSNQRMGKPVYLMDAPPTVENIALELATHVRRLLEPLGITVSEIRVWETPNCSATWRAPEGS